MPRRWFTAVWITIVAITLAALSAVPALAQAPAGAAQDGFVPITALPPSQQLPAAPFLIGAYAFIWLAVMFYLWSIWRRLGKVEHEMRALDSRSRKGAR
jgi:CcmD family protein